MHRIERRKKSGKSGKCAVATKNTSRQRHREGDELQHMLLPHVAVCKVRPSTLVESLYFLTQMCLPSGVYFDTYLMSLN